MPIRTYNTFYRWVSQDDFLSWGANFIDSKNIDGLRGGYFATLWPKSQKLIEVLDKPTSLLIDDSVSDGSRSFIWDESWNIYLFTWVDNTPSYTITSWYWVVRAVLFSDYEYFFTNETGFATMNVARISRVNAIAENWGGNIDETWDVWTMTDNLPVLVAWNFMYYPLSSTTIRRVDSSGVQTPYNFIDDYAVWLTLQGTTIKVYSRSGIVYFWDGNSSSYSSSQDYWFRIKEVKSMWVIDIVISDDWDFYTTSGYSMPTRVTLAQESLRLEDNSSYQNKLDFTKIDFNGRTLSTARQNIYAVANNDSVPWIYKFGKLAPGFPNWFNKIISTDNTNTDVDELYDIDYYEKDVSSMYFWFKQSSTYWVDFVDIKDMTTQQNWYTITDVFSWWTPFKKSINNIRVATSYTADDNYIRLYYRIDNWDWEEIRTFNQTTDTIFFEEITKLDDQTAFKQFVDIQFKVEFNNEAQDDTPPLLHELRMDYFITEADD